MSALRIQVEDEEDDKFMKADQAESQNVLL